MNHPLLHGALISFFMVSSFVVRGQDKDFEYSSIHHNAMYLEIGKTGLVFNAVYDHLFENNEFGIRAMFGTNFGGLVSMVSPGIGAYYIRGHSTRFLELGTDLQYFITNRKPPDNNFFRNSTVYPDYTTRTFYASANIGLPRLQGTESITLWINRRRYKKRFHTRGVCELGNTFLTIEWRESRPIITKKIECCRCQSHIKIVC